MTKGTANHVIKQKINAVNPFTTNKRAIRALITSNVNNYARIG